MAIFITLFCVLTYISGSLLATWVQDETERNGWRKVEEEKPSVDLARSVPGRVENQSRSLFSSSFEVQQTVPEPKPNPFLEGPECLRYVKPMKPLKSSDFNDLYPPYWGK